MPPTRTKNGHLMAPQALFVGSKEGPSPAASPPDEGSNLKHVIEELQKQHAFELSDAHETDDVETTIGVVLTGTRVKFVIPGSPGARPASGRPLEVDDVVLAVNGSVVDAHNVVEKVRGAGGANHVGSKVTMRVRRIAGGGKHAISACASRQSCTHTHTHTHTHTQTHTHG